MQVKSTHKSDNKVVLTISAGQAYLVPIKEKTLEGLRPQVKLQGFREGKAPLNLVEKNVDPQVLQTEFLDLAMGNLYASAVNQEKLRPVSRPQVTLKKFVPFTDLEFEAEIDVLGPVKLADYKKIRKSKTIDKVTDKDVQKIIENLKVRLAEKKEVKRAAAEGDEVWIDFRGTNAKNEPIAGADGKDYPLVIGSDSFIPGFEKNIEGMKPGDEKSFTLTFPKDYRAKSLAGSKVTFAVSVKKVHDVAKPKEDDELAKKVGPFKSLVDLKTDIKKQLGAEQDNKAQTQLEAGIITELTDKSTVKIPEQLVEEQAERDLAEFKQNIAYRGMTYDEFLVSEGKTAEEYKKEVILPETERKLKTSLILAEVSEVEHIQVLPEELEMRLQLMKAQYNDPKMLAELEKPEARQDIASRLITEKTINKLVEYASSK